MKALSLPAVLASAPARDALDWEFFREGIEVSWIYQTDDPNGPSAAFLKYKPGARVPTHNHTGFEHILVLEGSQTDENGCHKAGDLVINPPETKHSLISEDGCIVLAIWQSPVAFV